MIDLDMDIEEAHDEMVTVEIETVLTNMETVLILKMVVMALGETREPDQRPQHGLRLDHRLW